MTFKCHKVEEKLQAMMNQSQKKQAVLYPVHDLLFHPNQQHGKGFVATVGGDGIHSVKSKVCVYKIAG